MQYSYNFSKIKRIHMAEYLEKLVSLLNAGHYTPYTTQFWISSITQNHSGDRIEMFTAMFKPP